MGKEKELALAPVNASYIMEKALDMFTDVIGRNPAYEDFTDDNLRLFFDIVQIKHTLSYARNLCTALKRFLRLHEDIIPSENYNRILSINLGTGAIRLEYLTREELTQIYACKPEGNDEKYARCMFLLMAYTGAQQQDVKDFDIYNVNSKSKYLYYVNKQGMDVSVPLHPRVEELIREKMSLQVPDYSLENLSALREVLKKAKIAGTMETGEPRSEKIIFDDALKSFATYLYSQKVEVSDIQDVMGLKTRKAATRMIVGYNKKTKKTSVRDAITCL